MTECNCCGDEIHQSATHVWVTFGPNDSVAFVCGKDSDCVGDELVSTDRADDDFIIFIEGSISVMFGGEQLFATGAWSREYLDFVEAELAGLPVGSYDDGDYFRDANNEIIADSSMTDLE